MDAYREMMETLTEDVDVELASDAETIARGYLEEVGQVLIDLTNLVLRWEGVVDALGEFGIITIIIKQDGLSRLSVTTSTTCLLEVGFDGVGTVVVHDQTHVGLVDAHAKGVGADDDAYTVLLPVALALVFHLVVQSGMIEGGTETSQTECLGNLLGATTTAHIDNGRPLGVLEGVDEFLHLVRAVLDEVGEILAFEGHAEHGKTVFHTVESGFAGFWVLAVRCWVLAV